MLRGVILKRVLLWSHHLHGLCRILAKAVGLFGLLFLSPEP